LLEDADNQGRDNLSVRQNNEKWSLILRKGDAKSLIFFFHDYEKERIMLSDSYIEVF